LLLFELVAARAAGMGLALLIVVARGQKWRQQQHRSKGHLGPHLSILMPGILPHMGLRLR